MFFLPVVPETGAAPQASGSHGFVVMFCIFGETWIPDVFTYRVKGRDGGSECQGWPVASFGRTGPCGQLGGDQPHTRQAGSCFIFS